MDKKDYISPEEWSHISEENRIAIANAVHRDTNNKQEYKKVAVPNSFYVKYGKRLLDVFIGGTAFICCILINILIAVITFFDVGRPIFFSQERIGKGGKTFNLIKFRNMTNETNDEGILLSPEQRVTKWGIFVRRTSLDELMNFWHILVGDMSVIGPRPMPKKYANRFSNYHQQRHLVTPGLECPFHDKKLAQRGWQGRFDNDIWYVENVSLKTDIILFFLLVRKVFSREERIASASGRIGEFIGYKEDGSVMSEQEVPRKYLLEIEDKNEQIRCTINDSEQ